MRKALLRPAGFGNANAPMRINIKVIFAQFIQSQAPSARHKQGLGGQSQMASRGWMRDCFLKKFARKG
jgi:hypothetical protein